MSDFNNKSEKSALRKFLLNRRSSYASINDVTNNLHVHIKPLIDSFITQQVSIFQPYNNEIDTNNLITVLFSKKISISLPCIDEDSNQMIFRELKEGEELVKGKYGILEPSDKNKVIIPSVLFIPLLAFDDNGNRLGYGGGYYDKYIEELENNKNMSIKIGVGYSFQKINEVPNNSMDKKLNWILTEKYLYKV
ncbi:MAG: 5-formyltetrahydrofolate cyclo-ligase [Pelagibacterales bacterium]|nr:5-formyltetrahydrofolate cyclo-ligase [Pelagibacterales bacterium]